MEPPSNYIKKYTEIVLKKSLKQKTLIFLLCVIPVIDFYLTQRLLMGNKLQFAAIYTFPCLQRGHSGRMSDINWARLKVCSIALTSSAAE